MRGAEHFDQTVAKIEVLFPGLLAEGFSGFNDLPLPVVHHVGAFEGSPGVVGGGDSPFVDLLEVGQTLGRWPANLRRGSHRVERGVDIKGHDVRRQSQRVEPVVGLVVDGLDFAEVPGKGGEVEHGGAVDFLEGVVLDVGILGGQQGIGGDPVQQCSLPGAARPAIDSPGAVGVDVGVTLPLAIRVFDVTGAIGQVDDLSAALGAGGGGLGKLALVEVVDVEDHVEQVVAFGARDPVEVGMLQELVMGFECGEVVAPGVAVSLRIERQCIRLIHETVAVEVGDVVGHHVGDFPQALGEIPEEAVVDRPAVALRHTAQQGQLLLEQRGHLVLKGEHGSGHAPEIAGKVHVIVTEPDGGVLGIGIGFIAEQHVEIGQARGGEQQGALDARGGDR